MRTTTANQLPGESVELTNGILNTEGRGKYPHLTGKGVGPVATLLKCFASSAADMELILTGIIERESEECITNIWIIRKDGKLFSGSSRQRKKQI